MDIFHSNRQSDTGNDQRDKTDGDGDGSHNKREAEKMNNAHILELVEFLRCFSLEGLIEWECNQEEKNVDNVIEEEK